jgi:hypothetical protein
MFNDKKSDTDSVAFFVVTIDHVVSQFKYL